MLKRVLPFLFVVIIVGFGLWYFVFHNGKNDGPLRLYGNVDIRQVELGFRVPGRIETMHFEEGDAVKKNTLLASLDKQPFLDTLNAREAAVAQAAANLQKLEAGNRPDEIEQARALVNERKATLEFARQTFDRLKRLSQRDFASRSSYDQATAGLTQAKAALRSAELALTLAKEGPRKEDIAAARAALDAAKAQRDTSQTSLKDADLRAPADGIVLTRAVEPGAIVATGRTVYTLSLRKPVWVRAYVAEPNLGRIHPGLAVRLTTDTRPDAPYTGQIGFISPVAEFTPKTVETPQLRSDLVYRFRVLVRNADDALRQGMPVTVHIPEKGNKVATAETTQSSGDSAVGQEKTPSSSEAVGQHK
jgi:HlyD family secretion protein